MRSPLDLTLHPSRIKSLNSTLVYVYFRLLSQAMLEVLANTLIQ